MTAPAPPRLDPATGLFTGYASLFRVADSARDVVEPGAFAASLARRGVGGVRMLWQHDPATPIGTWLALSEDPVGLKVTGRLTLSVGRAREAFDLMRAGALDGLSIGFRPVRSAPDRRTGLRRLVEIDLWEVSLVTFPALAGARISRVG